MKSLETYINEGIFENVFDVDKYTNTNYKPGDTLWEYEIIDSRVVFKRESSSQVLISFDGKYGGIMIYESELKVLKDLFLQTGKSIVFESRASLNITGEVNMLGMTIYPCDDLMISPWNARAGKAYLHLKNLAIGEVEGSRSNVDFDYKSKFLLENVVIENQPTVTWTPKIELKNSSIDCQVIRLNAFDNASSKTIKAIRKKNYAEAKKSLGIPMDKVHFNSLSLANNTRNMYSWDTVKNW